MTARAGCFPKIRRGGGGKSVAPRLDNSSSGVYTASCSSEEARPLEARVRIRWRAETPVAYSGFFLSPPYIKEASIYETDRELY